MDGLNEKLLKEKMFEKLDDQTLSLFGIDKNSTSIINANGTLTYEMLQDAYIITKWSGLTGRPTLAEAKEMEAVDVKRKIYLAKKREYDKQYRRSLIGLIRRSHVKMKQRIKGNCRTPQIYANLSIMSSEDFIFFSINCSALQDLYKEWVISGYDIRLTPSVDRIDSSKGYVLGNIRWITHAQNSRLAGLKNKKS